MAVSGRFGPNGSSRVAAAAGLAVGLAFGAAAVVRRAKPLHPRGVVRPGRLTVEPPTERVGVDLLDRPGSHPCLVRTSRATGLPRWLPDVHGVALTTELSGQRVDLLLAGTGEGRWSRHVLVPRWRPGTGPATTIIPMRSGTGPVLLGLFPRPGADPDDPRDLTLRLARPGGRWTDRGRLRITTSGAVAADVAIRFDTVQHALPDLDHYPLVRVLREPAYAWARRGYRASAEPDLPEQAGSR